MYRISNMEVSVTGIEPALYIKQHCQECPAVGPETTWLLRVCSFLDNASDAAWFRRGEVGRDNVVATPGSHALPRFEQRGYGGAR